MWGTLHVVGSINDVPLDATQPSVLEETPPKRQFVRKWQLHELEPALTQILAGRQHGRGATLFKEVSCIQCHGTKGQGGKIGPDLKSIAQRIVDGKITNRDVLRSILEPSHDIERRYRTQIIVTADGKLLSGVAVEETNDMLILATNP